MGRTHQMREKWKIYSDIGKLISNTRFIPFKVPLRKETSVAWGVDFTPENFLEIQPDVKLIVDLTNTDANRYYNADSFRKYGIVVEKIKCIGGKMEVPSRSQLQRFYRVVDDFVRGNPTSSLIGVHCTHGLNRTGYFICKYMVEKLKIPPKEAIKVFECARGHRMERPMLINDILATHVMKKDQIEMRSPLGDCYGDEAYPSSFSRRSRKIR